MRDKEYLSTGEAAKLLGISRSTVSRHFDDGILLGKANPITGERLILAESAATFMKKHDRTRRTNLNTIRELVLRSTEPSLINLADSIVSKDDRIRMEVVENGTEALILCARAAKDLLILDDTDTDVAITDIIRSLKKLDDRQKLAVLCCLRDSNPENAALWGADAVVPMAGLQVDSLRARLYDLLGLNLEQSGPQAAPVEHRRQWPRHTLSVPGTIGVYRLRKPEEYIPGSVIVDNISLGGAGLSNVKVDSNSLPAESFRMLLQINTPLLPDWQAHCQVVRLKVNGQVTAGVQFTSMTQDCRDKILAFDQVSPTRE